MLLHISDYKASVRHFFDNDNDLLFTTLDSLKLHLVKLQTSNKISEEEYKTHPAINEKLASTLVYTNE